MAQSCRGPHDALASVVEVRERVHSVPFFECREPVLVRVFIKDRLAQRVDFIGLERQEPLVRDGRMEHSLARGYELVAVEDKLLACEEASRTGGRYPLRGCGNRILRRLPALACPVAPL